MILRTFIPGIDSAENFTACLCISVKSAGTVITTSVICLLRKISAFLINFVKMRETMYSGVYSDVSPLSKVIFIIG